MNMYWMLTKFKELPKSFGKVKQGSCSNRRGGTSTQRRWGTILFPVFVRLECTCPPCFDDPQKISCRRDDSRNIHWMDFIWNCLKLVQYALFKLDRVKSPYSISLQTLLSKSAQSEQILEISWSRSLLEWHLCFLSWLAVFSHARKTMVHLMPFPFSFTC